MMRGVVVRLSLSVTEDDDYLLITLRRSRRRTFQRLL